MKMSRIILTEHDVYNQHGARHCTHLFPKLKVSREAYMNAGGEYTWLLRCKEKSRFQIWGCHLLAFPDLVNGNKSGLVKYHEISHCDEINVLSVIQIGNKPQKQPQKPEGYIQTGSLPESVWWAQWHTAEHCSNIFARFGDQSSKYTWLLKHW